MADHLPEVLGLIPSPEMREEEEEEKEEEKGDEENTGQQLRQLSHFLIPSSLTMESSLPF